MLCLWETQNETGACTGSDADLCLARIPLPPPPAATPRSVGAAPTPTPIEMFSMDEGGYGCPRIPSAVADPTSDTMVVFAEGRSPKDSPYPPDPCSDMAPHDLVYKVSRGGGDWSELRVAVSRAAGGSHPAWGPKDGLFNPTPAFDPATGDLVLLFQRAAHALINLTDKVPWSRETYVTRSSDLRTWSKPRNISASVQRASWVHYATGPGHGIVVDRAGLTHGRMLFSGYHRLQGNTSPVGPDSTYHGHTIWSDDGGRTFGVRPIGAPAPASAGIDENQICVLKGKAKCVGERCAGSQRLLLSARNSWGVTSKTPAWYRAAARSNDSGVSWVVHHADPSLPEPHKCNAGFVRHNAQLYFTNPTGGAPGASWPNSTRLTLKTSADEGQTWADVGVVYGGPSGYSSVAARSDTRGATEVHVFFEFNYPAPNTRPGGWNEIRLAKVSE